VNNLNSILSARWKENCLLMGHWYRKKNVQKIGNVQKIEKNRKNRI